MRKYLLTVGIFLGSSVFALPLISVEASVGYMNHDPSGYLQYRGDRAELKDTFGLGKKGKPFARAKIELPIVPNLYLQYIPMSFTGEKNTNVKYGDVSFTNNLKTEVKLDHYDVGLYYNIPIGWVTSIGTLGTVSVDPEIGINVRVLNFKGAVTGTTSLGEETVSKTLNVPVPMGYVGLGINVPFVSLIGELRYIAYKGNRYYDIVGEARVKPIPLFYIGVGYREENIKLEKVSDVYSDIKIKSLFADVGVSF